jgi:hypothetical protein
MAVRTKQERNIENGDKRQKAESSTDRVEACVLARLVHWNNLEGIR